MKFFKKHFLYSFLTILTLISSNKVEAHGVQLAYCELSNGYIRVFIEHWHGDLSANDLPGNGISITTSYGTTSVTENVDASGFINNTTINNISTCGSGINVIGACSGRANNYGDWFYFDFAPAVCGQAITIKVNNGLSVYLSEACNGLYANSITKTFVDSSPPVITCQDVTVLSCDSAIANFTTTAADACDPNPTLSFSIASGSKFKYGTTQVTATATDNKNQSSTCTFNVIVQDASKPTIQSISSNLNPSFPGCKDCAQLTVNATGVGALKYTWNTSDTGKVVKVCPTSTTNYTVTVKDGNNCLTTSTAFTQNTIDARSPYPNRAIMCNNYRGRKLSMNVYSGSIENYLNAGAKCGSCSYYPKRNMDFSFDGIESIYGIYPNQAQNQITTEWFNLFNETVKIELVDMTGRVVKTIFEGEVVEGEMSLINTNITDLPTGMYFMRYSSPSDIRVNKVQVVR
jgi:hypothetical protein